MFNQDDQQNQQQHEDGGNQQPTVDNPAAPPEDHQFAPPQPAYNSIFEEHPQENAAPAPEPQASQQPVDQPEQPQPQGPAHQLPAQSSQPVDDENLLSIKKQALEQLSPLVGQLEQSPEEKFHTTMRIIQASDNHALLKEAHEAAQAIADDKVRAQALLDIINEINYFTQDEGQNGHAQQPEQVHGDDSTAL